MTPKISIIANFYKSRKYIPKLLKSVFNQSYTDWELICIDDCSPTNDHELLQKLTIRGGYSGKVRIIRNEKNLGISKAKKVGIDNARGEYLTFIDGDDWFEKDALKEMIIVAEKFNTDMVLMNSYRRYPLGYTKKYANIINQYNALIPAKEIMSNYYISFFGINKINVAYWGKLIRAEIVRKSKFQHNVISSEDLFFNAHIFPLLNSMIAIDYYGYNWRFGGITSSIENIESAKKLLLNSIETYRIKFKLAQDNNFDKAYHPMIVELKNNLLINFATIARYKENSLASISAKEIISKFLDIDDYRNNISHLLHEERYVNDKFIEAVASRNVNEVYRICHNIYRKNWKRRFLKQILRKLNFNAIF